MLKCVGYEHWFYPVDSFVYDEKYFDKYRGYKDSCIGDCIFKYRKEMIEKFRGSGHMLDVGVGCGQIVDEMPDAYGYDVNPTAVEMLLSNDTFFNPYEQPLDRFSLITFFDSLEHIENPEILLSRIHSGANVIVSIPVVYGYEDIKRSKHFRPDEHYHYFTLDGFKAYMADQGFDWLIVDTGEIECGRQDIYTFVFSKR